MADSGPATGQRRGGVLTSARTIAALIAIGLTAAVVGCAAAPTGGAPQKASGASGQPQAFALPMPPPAPQSSWSEYDVVLGFLHASASFEDNWAAARQYLTPKLRSSWRPGAVTVVGSLGKAEVTARPRAPVPGGLTQTQIANVSFTGQRLATLTASGQYLYEPSNSVYTFVLVRKTGTWLINQVPKGVLLLTQADFQDVYQPSNLYFFALPSPSVPAGQELVPDPVYAPIQGITRASSASSATLATGLVKGLLRGPATSWLSAAVESFFPAHTTLIGNQVRITGQNAIVNLGGGALRAQGTQIVYMGRQLEYTLTTGAYSAPVARSVKLEIAGKPVYTAQLPDLVAPVASAQSPEPMYFQSGQSSVSELASPVGKPVPAAGPAQIGQSPVTAVAAPLAKPQLLAIATKAGRGCAVYVGVSRGSGPYRRYPLSSAGGACTSLSWDSNANIWATAGQRVWVIRPHREPVQVSLPAGLPAGQKGLHVLALRMAPDGIRAAFLVHAAGANRVLLAAVRYHGSVASFGPAVTVGTGLAKAISISWYDPYNLVALAGGAVYEVPLTGDTGALRPLGAAPPKALSITTNGTELVFGTAGNEVQGAASSDTGWSTLGNGRWPAYPG